MCLLPTCTYRENEQITAPMSEKKYKSHNCKCNKIKFQNSESIGTYIVIPTYVGTQVPRIRAITIDTVGRYTYTYYSCTQTALKKVFSDE